MLLHAAVGDRRLWDEQVGPFSEHYRVLRPDIRGFGETPLPGGPFSFVTDLCALFDHVGIERAALVGNSLGARIALDFTLAHPERVSALVLAGPAPFPDDHSAELEAFGAEEDALLDAGRVDEAVELNVRTWIRTGGEDVRRRVAEMQKHAFEVQLAAYARQPEPGPVAWDDPPAAERLSEVAVPTLVVVGDQDVADVLRAADRLEEGIPGAGKEVLAGVGHVPALERPAEFNALVLEFLARIAG